MDVSSLLALCTQLKTALSGPGGSAYGVPSALVSGLSGLDQDLQNAATATDAARAAYLAQKAERDACFRATAAQASAIARAIYAVPTTTPAMILAAGLRPRATTRTKVVPVTPERLFATPQPNGDVKLEWARSGNAPGVNFVVEARTPGGEWAYAGDTTATRTILSGFLPGEPVEFRVIASKNRIAAAPSAVATVFPARTSSPVLRLAA